MIQKLQNKLEMLRKIPNAPEFMEVNTSIGVGNSNTEVVRIFSQGNIVKNKLRNRCPLCYSERKFLLRFGHKYNLQERYRGVKADDDEDIYYVAHIHYVIHSSVYKIFVSARWYGMASLARFQNGLNAGGNSPIKYKAIGAIIGGNHTDIVLTEYRDRLFVILSQYKKLGSLITVYKETASPGEVGEVYQVRTIQGREEADWELTARYLTERTYMSKPVLYAICMRDTDLCTLAALAKVIVQNKFW